MTDTYRVQPDAQFAGRILDEGGGDLNKCYQCATCSTVCDLSSGKSLFPRKEMLWAQWGLADRLMADPDVWLCHQCNDCSTRCPRGARPGDVLAAVRQECVEHYAVPGFLGRCLNKTACLPWILLAPVVLLVLALLLRGPIEAIKPLEGILGFLGHHGFYADFFPHWLLIGFFSFFTGLTSLAVLMGVLRFWRAMRAADEAAGKTASGPGLIPSAIRTIISILTHNKFNQCQGEFSRRWTHLLAFFGFVALFIVTVWAVIDLYFTPYVLGFGPFYPFALWHPMKILANIGCVILIVGCVKAILDRRDKKEEAGTSTTFDWVFVWLLLAVGVSGLLTEIFRLLFEPAVHAGEAVSLGLPQYAAYAIYFIHLVLVFDLLVYLPYSKFAHIVYRSVALIYAEHTGRNEVSTTSNR